MGMPWAVWAHATPYFGWFPLLRMAQTHGKTRILAAGRLFCHVLGGVGPHVPPKDGSKFRPFFVHVTLDHLGCLNMVSGVF